MNATRTPSKNWPKEKVQALLASSDAAVERAVVALYERQTHYEKVCRTTVERNHVGFNQPDSYRLSSFAQQVLRYKRSLTARQIWYARRRMMKYWFQLSCIAHENEMKRALDVA